MSLRPWTILPALIVCWLPAAATAAETARSEAVGLRFAVPRNWQRVPAASDVRAAQFRIPRVAGDQEDGELVLFYFGKAKGGGVEENLDRWYAQMTQPDGRPSREAGVVTIRTVNGLRITALDVPGTYKPMGPVAEAKPGYRMLAAVVEGPDGPWFWKAVGSEATMAAAKGPFDELLLSVEAHR
jgi:hypothetical protein